MHAIEIVSFVEVNQHFWSLEAIHFFVAYINSMLRTAAPASEGLNCLLQFIAVFFILYDEK